LRLAVNQRFLLCLALGAQGAAGRAGSASALDHRLRHSHDLIRHPVRFLLVDITGSADCQLGLNGPGLQKALHRLISNGLLNSQDRVEGMGRGRPGRDRNRRTSLTGCAGRPGLIR
jgi:hypothetical protein